MARIKISVDRPTIPTTERYGVWDNYVVGNFEPQDWWGYLYVVINKHSGRMYIGKKKFEGRKKRTSPDYETWKSYTTSSRLVNEELDSGVKFWFLILELCRTKEDLSEKETSLQKSLDVLHSKSSENERLYYNGTIEGKSFVNINSEPFSDERRKKIGGNRDYSKTDFKSEGYLKNHARLKERVWWNDGTNSFFCLPGEELPHYTKGRKVESRKCRYCGKETKDFIKGTPHFCDKTCRLNFSRLAHFRRQGCKPPRKRRERIRTDIPRKVRYVCKWCRKTFNRLSTERTSYCSEYCRKHARAESHGWQYIDGEQGECLLCGKTYTKRLRNQKYCSTKCGGKYRDKLKVVKRWGKVKLLRKLKEDFNLEPSHSTLLTELVQIYVQHWVYEVEKMY